MKKANTFVLLSLLLSLFCIGAESGAGGLKLRPPAHIIGDIAADPNWVILPRSDVYEVGASKLGLSSIRELSETGFRVLSEPEACHYTGQYYACPAGKRPYLMKAIYGKGGFGQFRVERQGSKVSIVWADLMALQIQRKEAYRRTAVVVNLDFTPEEVYTEFSCIP